MLGPCSRRELLIGVAVTVYALVFLYLMVGWPDEEITARAEPIVEVTVEQVHIAYGPGNDSHTSMFVSWSLPNVADECRLAHWSENSALTVRTAWPFVKLWSNQQYREVLTDLLYDQEYSYSIVCYRAQKHSAKEFRFRTNPGLKDNVTLLVLGDWATAAIGDAANPQHTLRPKANVLAPLLNETGYSGIWHLGDVAYDLFSNRGSRGDSFLRDVQPLAATQPYMVVVGNHEIGRFFQDFMQRFSLPGHGLYWSVGVGKAQVIAFSSEFDYNRMKPGFFPKDQSFFEKLKYAQLAWLESELQKAVENRAQRPWIVVMAHKPLYCSLNPASTMIMSVCGLQAEVMREVYEDLFLRYSADLLLFGHIHLYERLFPMAHDQVVGEFAKGQTVFLNPRAPIHIINGVAGNLENESIVMTVTETPGNWSAYMSESLGYGRLNILNSTHLHYVQYAFGTTQFDDISLPLVRRVEDEFWIVKTN